MDRPVPTFDRTARKQVQHVSLMSSIIKAALSVTYSKGRKPMFNLSLPSAHPTPRKNHAKGMRRKAKAKGRRSFCVAGKKRKA